MITAAERNRLLLRKHIGTFSALPEPVRQGVGHTRKGHAMYPEAIRQYTLTMVIVAASVGDAEAIRTLVQYRANLTPELCATGYAIANLAFAEETASQTRHALVSALNLAIEEAGLTAGGGTMSAIGRASCVESLIRDFRHLTLDDILLALRMGVEGKLERFNKSTRTTEGKVFNAITTELVLTWLHIYDCDRAEAVREAKERKAQVERMKAETEYAWDFEAMDEETEQAAREAIAGMRKAFQQFRLDNSWVPKQEHLPVDADGLPIEEGRLYYYPNGATDADGESLQVFEAVLAHGDFSPICLPQMAEAGGLPLSPIGWQRGWYWYSAAGIMMAMKAENPLLPLY